MKSGILRICRQCTPPIIWNFLRRMIIGYPPKNVTYTGMFTSFSEVSKNVLGTTNYHSEQSERTEVEEAQYKLLKYESGQVPETGATLPRRNFLPTALSFSSRKFMSILDVGGGLGTTFIDLKFSLPTKSIAVTIVELPSVVEVAREIFQKYPDIRFVSAFPKGDGYFDVIYFGSSLQYFENYISILQDSAALGPEFVVIADTTIGPAPSFACAQINMHGRVIPRMVFNMSELVATFAQHNYHLVHQSINYSPAHVFDNYAPPAGLTAHWNLVFQRDD